ncbi:hypothetical protein [Cohnella abietis]|uniref:Cytosolic protein n=1 Tax=Cohnella abietis TaxID=2507935 RepID=A0A3T1D2E4_9BACL|nr:hypothetical protein [Cohnella abietis]BBI32211.1 hypothetical protein KCTCHS21_16100 [Cohnella abietis]
MSPFLPEKKQPTTDLATVESQRNDLIPEEFPEGSYGSMILKESLGKSTPWREDQRPPNRFSYENRELHAGLDRDYPGDHQLHDLSGSDESELLQPDTE